jgi:serine/threonine protein kinase
VDPNIQPEVQARALHRYPKQDLHGLIPRAPQEAIDLLEGLLEFEPSQRLTAHEALRHPYFATNTASPAVGSNGVSSSQQQQQQAMLHQQAVIRQQQEQVSSVGYNSEIRIWLIQVFLGYSPADAATERATAVSTATTGCAAM